ncbi:hypothetical protein [Pseudomonas sp. p1(2021b)]|uniref:hypothetical protein n=1 Tax=Pseudomonas sp. p1(2021b) TaxID=2874628 RepID=UPI003D2BB43F
MSGIETVGELKLEGGLEIDYSGFRVFRKLAEETARKVNQSLATIGKTVNLKQMQAQMGVMHKEAMKTGKLQFESAKQTRAMDVLRTRSLLDQQRIASATAAEQRKAQAHELKMAKERLKVQGQELSNKVKKGRLANQQAILAARQARQAAQYRRSLERSQNPLRPAHGRGLSGYAGARATNRGGIGGFVSRFTSAAGGASMGVASGMGGGRIAGVGGRLGGMGVGGAAMAVTGFAVAAAAATTALYRFTASAERAANAYDQRNALFRATTGGDVSKAAGMERTYQQVADYLGLNAQEGGRDYAKAVGGMAGSLGLERSQDTMFGIMSYARSQGTTQEEMKLLNRGIGQALGKGQLYAEEWTGQIAEHLGPQANRLGAEAWAQVSGSGLTGMDAIKQFNKDREDRKIQGDKLNQFIYQLGQTMKARANEGGALDVARNSQEANYNRIRNQYAANQVHAFKNAGSDGTQALVGSIQGLLNALGPQFDQMAKAGQATAKWMGEVVQDITVIVDMLNSTNKDYMAEWFDMEALGEASKAFVELGSNLMGIFTEIGNILDEVFGEDNALYTFSSVIGTLLKAVLTPINMALTGVKQILEGVVWAIEQAKQLVETEEETRDRHFKEAQARQEAIQRRADEEYSALRNAKARNQGKLSTVDAARLEALEQARRPNMSQTTPVPTTGRDPDVPYIPGEVSAPAASLANRMALPPVSTVNPPVVNNSSISNSNNTNSVTNNLGGFTLNVNVDGGISEEEFRRYIRNELPQEARAAMEKMLQGAAAQQQNRY